MLSERVRLADLLAAVSVATDLGNGQEPEKAIRACLVATALARRMGTPEAEVSDVYYTALLRHLGCTATAHEEAWLVGDELAVRPAAERADFGNPREAFALLLLAGRGTGAGRVRHLVRSLRSGRKGDQAILGAVCEVGARLAERLGLGPGVRDGLSQSFERWDGTGVPGYHRGTSGAQVPAAARVLAPGPAPPPGAGARGRGGGAGRGGTGGASGPRVRPGGGRGGRAASANGPDRLAGRPLRPGGRGPAPGRPRAVEPRYRRTAVRLAPHRRASRAAHLHQDRRFDPRRRGDVRDGARPPHRLRDG
jgi:hypothetical protein